MLSMHLGCVCLLVQVKIEKSKQELFVLQKFIIEDEIQIFCGNESISGGMEIFTGCAKGICRVYNLEKLVKGKFLKNAT